MRALSAGIRARTKAAVFGVALGAISTLPAIVPAFAAGPPGFADIADQTLPAYVDVLVSQRVQRTPQQQAQQQQQQQQQQGPFDQYFRDFFDQLPNNPQQQTERQVNSQGSGFIIDKAGYIVTNDQIGRAHV